MKELPLLFFIGLICLTGCNPVSSESQQAEPFRADTLPARPAIVPDTTTPEKPDLLMPIDYDTNQWTELIRLDPTFQLDLKYATEDNFVQEQMYECGRCFLRPEAAQAVVRAHRQLRALNYGLLMLDCYRPHPIQWKLWEKVPDPRYVTNPQKGSMHNRGGAVDLTLTDMEGRPLDMGAPFDYFGQEAYHTFSGLPDSILERRALLKNTMEANGFRSIRTEWWHYSFQEKFYPLSDMLWKCYE
jgi:D-alanyl-D-alanine dipeptidase